MHARSTLLTVIAVFLVSAALAGPLNPPAGPVAPTAKPLAEVEPRTAINATNTPGDNDASPSLYKTVKPGSYYLTGNIAGEIGKHGIEIVASGVTIDLNGFDLVGSSTGTAVDGVSSQCAARGEGRGDRQITGAERRTIGAAGAHGAHDLCPVGFGTVMVGQELEK